MYRVLTWNLGAAEPFGNARGKAPKHLGLFQIGDILNVFKLITFNVCVCVVVFQVNLFPLDMIYMWLLYKKQCLMKCTTPSNSDSL